MYGFRSFKRFLFFIAVTSVSIQVYASRPEQEDRQQMKKDLQNKISLWAPHLNKEQRFSLSDYMFQKPIKIKPYLAIDKSCDKMASCFFGFSSPYSGVAHSALIEIQRRVQKGCPPVVWDLACGHGFFSIYAAIAGAKPVYAFDKKLAPLQHLAKTSVKMKQYFPEGFDQEKDMKINRLDLFGKKASFFEKYAKPDIIICFDFLHYLNPELQRSFVKSMYGRLKSGGNFYISGDSYYNSKSTKEIFLKRLQEKQPAPGYCWIQAGTISSEGVIAKTGRKIKVIPDDFPSIDRREPIGGLGIKFKQLDKMFMSYNFLHPDPFREMLSAIKVSPEFCQFFYDGYPKGVFLISGSDVEKMKGKHPYKMVAIINKPAPY